MKTMKMRRYLETLATLSLAANMAACAGDAQTIDRTQPNALDKAMFEGLWYERATIVSASPESGETIGIVSSTEKLRWEITEELLIGYRSYELLPYAEGLNDEGRDFFGAPVVAYPISGHFDIQREYNTTSGVENNVISENTTDRPWHERRYFRVDWSRNVVKSKLPFFVRWESNYPTSYLTGIPGYYVQSHEEDNPDRPYITDNYFDITNVFNIEPDEYYCAMMQWYNFIARCGTGEVKVRLSFKKIDPTNDFQALYYPDVVELRDNSGNAIVTNGDGHRCDSARDPGECFIQTYPYDAQFGNFRIQRVAFDRERFLTRSGRIYAAGRFDLWKNSYNDLDGALIPYADREAQPIIYYGNVDFPEDMYEPADRLAKSWNIPFLETVAVLQGDVDASGRADVAKTRQRLGFDMFQFQKNDCNVENVKAYATKNGHEDVVNRIAGNIDRVARGNLEKVCAAIQFADLKNGKRLDGEGDNKAFQWQRTGDLRYNFQNYIEPLNYYGPWGVAQFAQDPETGEFFANVGNYFGVAGDTQSQAEVDVVQWLNGDITEEELFRGDFTRNTVISRRSAQNNNVRDVVRQALQQETDREIAEDGGSMLSETTPDADDRRFARMFGGSDIERELLVNDEFLRTFAGPDLYQPYNAVSDTIGRPNLGEVLSLVPGDISEDALAKASPVSWGTSAQSNFYMKMVEDLGSRAFEMADFFDANTSGLAESFKGESRDKIYEFMRKELYVAVEAHEVGHTLGLRHNFQGSIDALNYHPDFWYKENDDGTVTQYWNNKAKPGNANRGAEYKYSSIMDYGFDVPLEGLHGIGSYDKAAIRFFYGQLVDMWDPQVVSLPDPRRYGSWARRCGHDSDFLGAPGLMYWLGPASIPAIFSAEPVLEEDGSVCRPIAPRTNDRNRDCVDDLNTEIDESAAVVNYDAVDRCDSVLDKTYRDLVTGMEATADRNGQISECAIWWNIDDLNEVFEKVGKQYPDPSDEEGRQLAINAVKRIYGGRKPVPVDNIISQRIAAIVNTPEYDLPGTTEDEARNCLDDDNDGEVDDKGYDWSQYKYQVDYAYCSDYYAGFSNPWCQRWDTGWDFREATDNHIMRYDRDYVFDHFRRDRSWPWGNGRSYMMRLEARRFFHMTNVYRFYLYTRSTAFKAPLFDDWAAAAYKGLNFLERVIQTPEPGRYCLNASENRYELDYTGTLQPCASELTVGLGYGEGKFLDTSWTNEYHYKPNRIGALYDKLAAMRQMTSSSGIFVRDAADLFDRRAFSLGYMRVFEDPMLQRFSALIQNDHTGYESVVATDDQGAKYVRYMPFFDEEFNYGSCTQATERTDCTIPNTSCNAAPNQTGVCVGGSVRQSIEPLPKIAPAWSWTLQFLSLAYALGNFSSIADYAPEFYRFTKIAIKGTPEDIDYGPDMAIVEFTDPETRITYRAPGIEAVPPPGLILPFPSYYGDPYHRSRGEAREWGIGADLLNKAQAFVDNEWTPKQALCPDLSANSEGCRQFREARRTLNDFIGYIDIIRKFNKQAEFN